MLGAFVAGGGAFDWEFLFSDGHREHEWVRNMGRGGARGLLMLVGSAFVVAGFVGQVAAAAAKPVDVAANALGTPESGTPERQPPSGGSVAGFPWRDRGGSPASTKAPPVPDSSLGLTDAPPATFLPPAGDGPTTGTAGPQPITIWNPRTEAREEDTVVRVQYRFEAGHRPLANGVYYWIISAASKTTEVEYDFWQNQGQLEYTLRVLLESSGLKQYWTTMLVVDIGGKRSQASNRLQITGGHVQATPLTAAGR
jgi:hypothetical protein